MQIEKTRLKAFRSACADMASKGRCTRSLTVSPGMRVYACSVFSALGAPVGLIARHHDCSAQYAARCIDALGSESTDFQCGSGRWEDQAGLPVPLLPKGQADL